LSFCLPILILYGDFLLDEQIVVTNDSAPSYVQAGSSVPICFWRDPPTPDHDLGTPLHAALMLSYGHLEAYGYHGLEALQAQVE
jgi:hypothetical protein